MLLLQPVSARMLRALSMRVSTSCGYCKDYSSSDDEKVPKSKPKKLKKTTISEGKTEMDGKESIRAEQSSTPSANESAVARLNRLLASMPKEDSYTLTKKTSAAAWMARPGAANQKRKDTAKQDAESKNVFAAAKRIASLVGNSEQQQQTESELLAKLLGHDQVSTDGNDTDNMLKDSADASKKSSSDLSLSELIVGMKIDRKQQPKEEPRSEYVRRVITAKTTQQQQSQTKKYMSNTRNEYKREAETYTGSVNLFGSAPLGIFKNSGNLNGSTDILNTWSQLEEHELQQQVARPSANYFEKMALWTEQGKVWRFPIDNEQDLVEEVNVDFSEHIFLEQHLEAWCPNKGPIRHFMELVCVGLSKNPYLTAKEKKEHILWYRDYFETKRDLLKDLISSEQTEKVITYDKQLQA